ncbi:HlyD family secretion protein [Cohaesibacter marisflavi]|uniref:HlyD family secretion protein n=1 Tax=Cohaesibacter marisflavi TaxID=655353 RepID=UPI0029C833E1|nr:HlyD family secretion protein [Cohaesibacter marisflavi]
MSAEKSPADPAQREERAPSGQSRPGAKRRTIFKVIGLAVLVVAAWLGYEWWTVGRFVESTDDAYVRADIITYSAEVSGSVQSIPIEDNRPVKKGDLLVRIDDTAYLAKQDQAKAGLASAEAALANLDEQIGLQHTQVMSAEADLSSAKAQLTFARANAERGRRLLAKGSATRVTVEQNDMNLEAAEAAFNKASAALKLAKGQFDVLASQRQQRLASVSDAQATLKLAKNDLAHVEVRAGYDGVIGNRGIDQGEYVTTGTRLLSLVPLQDIYVEANFKETQVRHFREGMKVSVSADMLGGIELKGHIDSLSPATGSEFALMAPQNATGNFTKIVQRIPVKILIDTPDTGEAPALRPGTSVVVEVDTHQDED